MTDYVTIQGVEVLSAGMAWNGLTGPYYVTAEHLAAMVAAQDDPLIRAPRVKLGHLDPRFNGGLSSHDPANLDADPAFGTLANLRLTEGGAKLVADLIEVPKALAEAIPSAFPNRSAEWVWDYETAGENRYATVLTDVALLGTRRPAVQDLADIVRASLPAAVAAPILDDLTAAAAARQEDTLPEAPSASVSVERVVGTFYEWTETQPVEGLDMDWWWARDIRVDPDEVIASDGDGGTWRVPFSTDGEHVVTFSDPVEVRETYVDVAAPTAAAAAAAARSQQRVIATDLPRPAGRRNTAAAGRPDATPEQEDEMPDLDTSVELRNVLGLAADASDEDVQAALAARNDEPAAEADEPENTDGEQDPIAETQTAELAAATQRIADLERQNTERERREAATRRDGLATQWVQEGRIAPSERDHYRDLLDVDEDRTVALAGALAAGRIPVGRETGAASANDGSDDTNVAPLPWFPELAPKEA